MPDHAAPEALRIRPAVVGDRDGLIALYRQFRSRPVEDVAQADAIWARMLAMEALTVLVAERHGTLVGTCLLVVVPNLTSEGRSWAIIENVVTDAAHRRQGIGRAVLAAAVARAWELGCYKVALMTGSRQDSTLRFYEGAGFRRGTKTSFEIRAP